MDKNKKLQIAGILLLFPTIISVILGPATVNSYYSFSMALGLIFIISLFTTLPIGIVLIVRGRKEKTKEIKIKGIKEKIQLWKDEGYNVDELEQMIEFVGIDKSEIEKYCSDCGHTVSDDANICSYCGEKFDNA